MPLVAAGSVSTTCPGTCEEAMAQANAEVGLMRCVSDPFERKIGIMRSYQQLGQAMPDNWWVRLAGYVSVQAGCAMRQPCRCVR